MGSSADNSVVAVLTHALGNGSECIGGTCSIYSAQIFAGAVLGFGIFFREELYIISGIIGLLMLFKRSRRIHHTAAIVADKLPGIRSYSRSAWSNLRLKQKQPRACLYLLFIAAKQCRKRGNNFFHIACPQHRNHPIFIRQRRTYLCCHFRP